VGPGGPHAQGSAAAETVKNPGGSALLGEGGKDSNILARKRPSVCEVEGFYTSRSRKKGQRRKNIAKA